MVTKCCQTTSEAFLRQLSLDLQAIWYILLTVLSRFTRRILRSIFEKSVTNWTEKRKNNDIGKVTGKSALFYPSPS